MEPFVVEWLPLSLFDSHAHFSLCVGDLLTADVHVQGGTLVVKKFVSKGDLAYQTASFDSHETFAQFLKLAIKRLTS